MMHTCSFFRPCDLTLSPGVITLIYFYNWKPCWWTFQWFWMHLFCLGGGWGVGVVIVTSVFCARRKNMCIYIYIHKYIHKYIHFDPCHRSSPPPPSSIYPLHPLLLKLFLSSLVLFNTLSLIFDHIIYMTYIHTAHSLIECSQLVSSFQIMYASIIYVSVAKVTPAEAK